MKIKYPPISWLKLREMEIDIINKKSESILFLALTPEKDIVVVNNLRHRPIWINYWKEAEINKKPYNEIRLSTETEGDTTKISYFKQIIMQTLNYIVANNLVLLGICRISNVVPQKELLHKRKKKNKPLLNMQEQFRKKDLSLDLDDELCISYNIMGKGEKFILEDFNELLKITQVFKGSLSGICAFDKKKLNFIILGQTLTKKEKIPDIVIDNDGKEGFFSILRNKQMIPVSGFKIYYGLWSLQSLKQFTSLMLLPDFKEKYELYIQYLNHKIHATPYKTVSFGNCSIYNKDFRIEFMKKEVKEMLTPEEVMAPPKPSIPANEATSSSLNNQQHLSRKPVKAHDSQLKKPDLSALSLKTVKPIENQNLESLLPEIPLEKPSLTPLNPIEPQKILPLPKPTVIENGVDNDMFIDVFETDEMFEDEKQILYSDYGYEVDTKGMSKEEIMADLEQSLNAISQLDELSQKDEAVSRIYYPPPTLISFAEEKGIEIGGSTCILSMGTGRNIWMIPELRRMQMYGKFYEDADLNDQIEDFIAMEEKDIDTPQMLEDVLQKAFINIKKWQRVFMGILQIEGNGFESDPGFGFSIQSEFMQKLTNIHTEKRKTIEFPKLSEESYVEVRYRGAPKIIEFIHKPDKMGILDIADEIKNDPRYKNALICGIICTDFNAVYFYVLVNNFDRLDRDGEIIEEFNTDDDEYSVDLKTLNKMFKDIKKDNLTPVSWFKLDYSINGLKDLFYWDDIKDGVTVSMILKGYNEYVDRLLDTFSKEKEIEEEILKEEEL